VRLTKINLQEKRAVEAQNPTTQCYSRRLSPVSAIASAAAMLFALAGNPAHALGLGRITVQSALGEALRAEIEVPEISVEEASTLRVGVASAEAFKAAGLEYSAAVVGVQVSLQKRPNGRFFLRLSSSRPVTEPFVDLILDASWGSGRLVRDYTMLFDPPNLRQASPAMSQPTAPMVARPAAPPATSPTRPTYSPVPPAEAQAPVKPPAVARSQAQPPTFKAIPTGPASTDQKVTVKPGDNAGRIASQNKPANISLDQMLVALLRSNPDAFIGGNVNRLKAGAVLDMPSAEQAGSVSNSEATSTIVAQAKDFNDFRQKLAAGVPTTQVEAASRKAGGNVQAKVEDRPGVAATPDKLTLSKGGVQSKAAAEEKIAKEKQAKDATSRVAELTKNIDDLNKIAGTSPTAPATTPASAVNPPVVPGLQVPTIPTIAPAAPVTATNTTAVAGTASVAAPAPAAASASSAPGASAPADATTVAPTAAKKPAAVPPPVQPEPSMIDELTENPLVLPGLGILLALLAGLGFYRYKKRNEQLAVDSSFLESRLQPDSFFGASGGQRIDTTEGGAASGSSLVYSPSQLDAAGDVDPVAEADVYLAYGRDLQAEEILKEALRTNHSRVAIHAKLMEIYAKRRDLKAFEAIAVQAHALTRGNGPEWAYISELGRDLDPSNSMYQPGGQPTSERGTLGQAPEGSSTFGAAATMPQMLASPPPAPTAPVDFDLDLDFSESDESLKSTAMEPLVVPDSTPVTAPTAASARVPSHTPEPIAATQVKADSGFGALDLNFGDEPTVGLSSTPMPKPLGNGLSFNLDAPPVVGQTAATSAKAAVPLAEPDNGMLEFDMSSLSLDLDSGVTQSPTLGKGAVAAAPATVQGPLETKLSLAEEFHALGDSDGARSLANEVVAQADGPLKSKALAFLNTVA
jgi:pilus assembly protein FimV